MILPFRLWQKKSVRIRKSDSNEEILKFRIQEFYLSKYFVMGGQ